MRVKSERKNFIAFKKNKVGICKSAKTLCYRTIFFFGKFAKSIASFLGYFCARFFEVLPKVSVKIIAAVGSIGIHPNSLQQFGLSVLGAAGVIAIANVSVLFPVIKTYKIWFLEFEINIVGIVGLVVLLFAAFVINKNTQQGSLEWMRADSIKYTPKSSWLGVGAIKYFHSYYSTLIGLVLGIVSFALVHYL
jgi:hypothetical protein